MDTKKRFTKGEVAEIRELYLGTWTSVKELAQIFGVSVMVMRYYLDYKGCRKFQMRYSTKWRKQNPEKAKVIRDKAGKKWRKQNPEKVRAWNRANYKRYYQKNKKKILAKQKKRYAKTNKTLKVF